MFIGQNFHVAGGDTNVTEAGISNNGSAHSNMKISAHRNFHNKKQTRKECKVHAQLQMAVGFRQYYCLKSENMSK